MTETLGSNSAQAESGLRERPAVGSSNGREAVGQVVFQVEHVYKLFVSRGKKDSMAKTALRDINLEIRRGEFVTFIGPSGCGKSTVLNMLAGLLAPTSGRVLYEGREIHGVNTAAGYVTQDDNLLPWRTLLDNVSLALEFKGVDKRLRREKANQYLQSVGLSGFESYYPHELSGGMRKRGSIVRTLVYEPDTILMDEPFGPLDAQTRVILQDELLRLWQGSGRTIVFVTHDLVEAIALSDRIVIFTSTPGEIKAVHEVNIPRPRDVFHIHSAPEFRDIFDTIWVELREEILKARQNVGAESGG
jgi:NitT/TauT family transport system ATP-binding protein